MARRAVRVELPYARWYSYLRWCWVQALFGRFGDIIYVKIPLGKGCGFVQFVKRRVAEVAMAAMQSQVPPASRMLCRQCTAAMWLGREAAWWSPVVTCGCWLSTINVKCT